jgi:DNA-binding NarL/FixJ family response regulator
VILTRHVLICSGVRAYSEALANQIEQLIDLPLCKVATVRSAVELTETVSTRGRYAVVLDARDDESVPISMALRRRPAVLGILILGEDRWENISAVGSREEKNARPVIHVLSPFASVERLVDELRHILGVQSEPPVAEEPVLPSEAVAIQIAERRPYLRTIESLTPRQLQVVGLISSGFSNKEIAARLSISEATVKNHVHELLRQLDLTKRTQVAALMKPSDSI